MANQKNRAQLLVEQILTEAKQVGTVYHFTSFDNALKILESNTLNSSEERKAQVVRNTDTNPDAPKHVRKLEDASLKYISFTRNKNFTSESTEGDDIAFIVNGNKLSNKYKFQPINMQALSDPTESESEERVLLGNRGEITNFKDYILGIMIRKNNWDSEEQGESLKQYIQSFLKLKIPVEFI